MAGGAQGGSGGVFPTPPSSCYLMSHLNFIHPVVKQGCLAFATPGQHAVPHLTVLWGPHEKVHAKYLTPHKILPETVAMAADVLLLGL